jgi:HSP20 family molecular chaperone IbpA
MTATGAFNANALLRAPMKLREALADLPETVFADLLEDDDTYLLVIDLPGATAETVDVTIEGGRLSIEARREKSVPREFQYISEERALFLDAELPLPPNATGADADGTIERGVLTLTLPKSDADGGQRIPIS